MALAGIYPGSKAPKESKSTKSRTVLRRLFGSQLRSSSPSFSQTDVRSASPLDKESSVQTTVFQLNVDQDTDLEKLQNATKIAFSGVQMLLKMVERSTDVIPLVKSPIAAFNACLDLYQKIRGNHDELISLIRRFDSLASFLAEQMNKDGRIRETMDSFSTLAKLNMDTLKKRALDVLNSNTMKQVLDVDHIATELHEISQQLAQWVEDFQLKLHVNVECTVNDILSNVVIAQLPRSRHARFTAYTELDGDGGSTTTISRDECTKGTRTNILNKINRWALSTDVASSTFYWINGYAGTGKTSIAYSVCQHLEESKRVVSYFCSRQLDSRRSSLVLPTVAYQLASRSRAFARHLVLHLQENLHLLDSPSLSEQVEGLLCKPWKLASSERSSLHPVVIVIDALDECDRGNDVLRELVRSVHEYELRGIKFLVTGRPEPQLAEQLTLICDGDDRSVHLHYVSVDEAEQDVSTFLSESLQGLAERDEIVSLSKQSKGLFIYASTIVKYIKADSRRYMSRDESRKRLTKVLSFNHYKSLDDTQSGRPSATRGIDELYHHILSSALSPADWDDDELAEREKILYTIVCTKESSSPEVIADLTCISAELVTALVQSLYSVLFVSDSRILAYHASFPDYLCSPGRNLSIRNDSNATHRIHRMLTMRCLEVMKSSLKFNICSLDSSFIPDEEIPDLQARVSKSIDSTLAYSCRYWCQHLTDSRGRKQVSDDTMLELVNEFFESPRTLFWVEAMSLLRQVRECKSSMRDLDSLFQNDKVLSHLHSHASELTSMVEMFMSMSGPTMTSHLYLSILAIRRENNPLLKWKRYFRRLSKVTSRPVDEIYGAVLGWNASSPILSVAFSPCGKWIASSSRDKKVRIWDAETGKEVFAALDHDYSVNSVAFSANSKQIVSGSDDHTVRIWDAETGKEAIPSLKGHGGSVLSVAFSPNGKQIVSGSTDETVRIWDAETGKEVIPALRGNSDWVYSVTFSPDGKQIVSGSGDRKVRVWDAVNGKGVVAALKGHDGPVGSVAFSPNGKQIVSGSGDTTVRIWSAETGKEVIPALEGHDEWVASVAFSPDGEQIVSGAHDKTVRIWSAETGKEVIPALAGHHERVNSVAFSPDGKQIVSGSSDWRVRIWSAETSKEVVPALGGDNNCVYSVAFSPDGNRTVSGSEDAAVRIWDIETGMEVNAALKGHDDSVYSVAFSPNGKQIVSGSLDKTVRIWDVETGKEVVPTLVGHEGWVQSVAFSPNGKQTVSGSGDGTVRIWNTETGKEVVPALEGHDGFVTSVEFCPDGNRIVSGSDDQTVRIWDTETGKEVIPALEGHDDWVRSVAFSPDGKQVVSGSNDKTVRIWNAETGKEVIPALEGHTDTVTSVAFSPDGKRIVSGSGDGTVRIWNTETGKEAVPALEGHNGFVTSVKFSPDGKQIVSCSDDETVRIWDVDISYGTLSLRTDYVDTNQVKSVHFHSSATLDPPLNSRLNEKCTSPYTLCLPPKPAAMRLSPDSWILIRDQETGKEFKLMWLYPGLVRRFSPRATLVISKFGWTNVDFSDCLFGERWAECYQP